MPSKKTPPPGKNAFVEDAMKSEGLLTAHDVTELCHVSKATVSQWGITGKVATRKVGSRVFFDRASLMKFLGPEGARLLGIADTSGAAS